MDIARRHHLAALLLTLVVVGCSTTNNPIAPTGTSPNDVHGIVTITDQYRNARADRSGVVVTVAGTSWTRSDTTDALGKWHVYDAPAGVYTITAMRDSCDTAIIRGQSYSGADSLLIPALRLTMPLSLAMITTAQFDVRTEYVNRIVDSMPRTDTMLVIKITATTPCRNGAVWFRWDVFTSTTEDCDAFEISGGDIYTPSSGTLTYERSLTYADLHSHFGASLVGKQLYIHLRCGLPVAKTAANPKGCYPATIHAFTL